MFPPETLSKIVELSRSAVTPFHLDINDAFYRRFLVGGQEVSISIPEKRKVHRAHSLCDLINYANDEVATGKVTVWCDRSKVVAVADCDERTADRMVFDLQESQVFKKICELEKSRAYMSHRDFVRLLKIDLFRCFVNADIVKAATTLKFSSGEITTATVGLKRESLGSTANAEVTTSGKGNLPEEVLLGIPVYINFGERTRYDCLCSLEVRPVEQDFRLAPLPDQVTNLYDQAMLNIMERLRDGLASDVTVYHGAEA